MAAPRYVSKIRTWLVAHPVEIVFALLVAATFAYGIRITGGSYFWLDEWLYVRQGRSLSGLFSQYNGHLSVVVLAIYQALTEAFGFAYTPFRVAGLLALMAVPTAYFVSTRRALGAPLAALAAMPLLWFSGMSLFPAEMNFNWALVGGIVCAASLDRGPRADKVLAGALAFSLCSAGGGVAVGAACLVHHACTRPPLRRWLAVVVPLGLWGCWWLAIGRTRVDASGLIDQATPATVLVAARDLAFAAFENLGFQSGVLAMLLVATFVGLAVWRLTQGRSSAANIVAWSAALAVWGVGLAVSRGPLASPDTSRYEYVATCFVLLAVVPRRPIDWRAVLPVAVDRRLLVGAAGVVLVVGVAVGSAGRGSLQEFAMAHAAVGGQIRGQVLVASADPPVLADDTDLGLNLGGLDAGEIRELLESYGEPFAVTASEVDRRLVDIGAVRVRGEGRRALDCEPFEEPFLHTPGPYVLRLGSPEAYTVDIRRFSDDWVRVAEGRPGEVLTLTLPVLSDPSPWEVRAVGACLVKRE